MWIPGFVKQWIIDSIVEKIKENKPMFDFINGNKTYIIMALGILVNGLYAMNLIDLNLLITLDGVIGALGLGTIRHGISKLDK